MPDDLDKMALADVRRGRKVAVDGDEAERYDYSHLLAPEQRAAGYALHVRLGYGAASAHSLLLHRGAQVGHVLGFPRRGGTFGVTSAKVEAAHRGGKGVPMYEALLAHAKNHMGARIVEGDEHSTMASAVHRKLAAKHGMEYHPMPNDGEYAGKPGPNDDRFAGYEYALKSEGNPRRRKMESLVASVAAFDDRGRLLFGLREDNKRWTLPGGHLEEGEDPEDAARRELREEAGLDPVGELEFLGHGVVRRQSGGNVRVFCYRAKVEGEPSGEDDPDGECKTWRWAEGLPPDIAGNLHSRNNVTLRLLGLQEGEVRKHEVLAKGVYWRVHPAGEDPVTLLDPAKWNSRVWSGHKEKLCPDCHEGRATDGGDCPSCRGRGVVEDVRRGVSAMRSPTELARYMGAASANVVGDSLVEMEGDPSPDEDHDAEKGAVLVFPRRIRSVRRISGLGDISGLQKAEGNDFDLEETYKIPFGVGQQYAALPPEVRRSGGAATVWSWDPATDVPDWALRGDAGQKAQARADMVAAVEQERRRQLAVWESLRKPEDGDVDHALRHPDPAQRSLALKLPGVERRHVLRAFRDEALRRQAVESPAMDAGAITELLSDPRVTRTVVAGGWPDLVDHPAADSSHVAQAVNAGCLWLGGGSALFAHPKMDDATLLKVLDQDHPNLTSHVNKLVDEGGRDWSKLHPDALHELAKMWAAPGVLDSSSVGQALRHAVVTAGAIRPDTARAILDRGSREMRTMLAISKGTPCATLAEMADHRKLLSGHLDPNEARVRALAVGNRSFPKSSFGTALTDPANHVRVNLATHAEGGRLSPEQELALARDDGAGVAAMLAQHTSRPETLRELHRSLTRWRGADVGVREAERIGGSLYRNPALPEDVQADLVQQAHRQLAPVHSLYQLGVNPSVSDEALRGILAAPTAYLDAQKFVLADSPHQARVKPEWLDPMVDSTDPETKRALLQRYKVRDSEGQPVPGLRHMSYLPPVTPQQLERIVQSADARASMDDSEYDPQHLQDVVRNRTVAMDAMKRPDFPQETLKRIALAPGTNESLRMMAVSKGRFTPEEMGKLDQWRRQHGNHVIDTVFALHPDASPGLRQDIMAVDDRIAWEIFEHHPEVLTPSDVEWGLKRTEDTSYGNLAAMAVGHRYATPEHAEALVVAHPGGHSRAIDGAINSGKLSLATLKRIAEYRPTPEEERGNTWKFPKHTSELAAQVLAKESPDSVFQERVAAKFNTGKLRKVRDLIVASGKPSLHPRELPPGDWSAGRGRDGNVHADLLQRAIDSAPALNFNVSHDKWTGAQRHSRAASKVFQVNLTDDHVRRMKEAGVYDTFRKMQEASSYSGHPVSPQHGIGWVRYTGNPRSGFFIDEVQSDFGQSFVRQAAAQAREEGADEAEAARRAQEDYPEEHFKAISQILFGGKHPNEVLHEAFQQHLRDRGHHAAKVAVHSVESKAPISLGRELPRKCATCGKLADDRWHHSTPHQYVAGDGGCKEPNCASPFSPPNHPTSPGTAHDFVPGEVDRTKAPGHFSVTYWDTPKKLGMEPAKYGERRPETNKEMKGQPVWAGTVRKAEALHWNVAPEDLAHQLSGSDWDRPVGATFASEHRYVPASSVDFTDYDDFGGDDEVAEQGGRPPGHVGELENSLRAGRSVPPVVAERVGQGWHVWDGAHRMTAARRAGVASVPVVEMTVPPPIAKAESGVPPEIADAFVSAWRHLKGKLDGNCVEASSLMARHLRDRGHSAEVVRRDSGSGEGHWTVRHRGVEYDPTIQSSPWSGLKGGGLHVVNRNSPHGGWKVTGTSETDAGVRQHAEDAASEWLGKAERRSPADLARAVRGVLSDELRRPRYQGNENPLAGHCYVASEAAYHLMGGRKSGWVPQNVRHEGDSHWFLRHRATGEVLDPTAEQFRAPVPYELGVGKGFLTAAPSARAREVISRVRRTRKYEGDLGAWLAGLPLEKMAVDPAHLKMVALHHAPSGKDYVDDSGEGEAHPKSQEHLVGLFRSKVLDSEEVVKRGRIGAREGNNRTAKAVYDVGDHRFLLKPYHEQVSPAARAWMRHPIQGWAEMTNQALYHAAGIGHLHQEVHVARVPMDTPAPAWFACARCGQPAAEHADEGARKDVHGHEFRPGVGGPFPGTPPDPLKCNICLHPGATHHPFEGRDGDGRQPALVIHMRPGVVPVAHARRLSEELSEAERQQVKRIGVMDFLSNNLDRHGENLLWDPAARQFLAVDHSRSFQYVSPTKWERKGGSDEPDSLSNYFTTRDDQTALDDADPALREKDLTEDEANGKWTDQEYDAAEAAFNRAEEARHLREWAPVMEWWSENGAAARRTMAKRLKLLKDPAVREHVSRNFSARADHLDGLARMLDAGVESKAAPGEDESLTGRWWWGAPSYFVGPET